jgi:hypothetical protein
LPPIIYTDEYGGGFPMKRIIAFVFILALAPLALYTSAGCSGGIDQLALQNLESGALNTCDGTECSGVDPEEDAGEDPSNTTASIYENLLCSEDTVNNESGKSTPFRQTTGGQVELEYAPASLCGRYVSPPVQIATHEPVLPFNPVIFCNDQEVPLHNPHPSCSVTSDINATYMNVPAKDFGICALRLDDEYISVPYFVYRNNGQELSRYEILRTCVERLSCALGTFRSTGIGLIEAATESDPVSDDITFLVLRAVDNYIVEASDLGNLTNAALVLEDVGLPVDDDIVSHNQHHMDTVITFIEDNCVE